MPFPKWIRWNINLWFVVVTAAATIFAGVEMLLAAGPESKAPSPGMATAAPASLSPIPVPDLLAQPRSLKQFGVPLLQTLAEIPTDNLQTPERIALGEKLFSSLAYRWTEPWHAPPAIILTARLPTASLRQ
jgi:hypothetical protein